MPYVRKVSRVSRKRTTRKGIARRYRRRGIGYRKLSRRISAVSRRVAGEVCKFEITPNSFTNSTVTVGTGIVDNHPLNTITSGTPWIMPLNWFYEKVSGSATGNVYYNDKSTVVPAGAAVRLPL